MLKVGLSMYTRPQAAWWLQNLPGAGRVADYKNARYMSLGKPVQVGAVSNEARTTPATVRDADGTLREVGANALAIGAGVGLQVFGASTNILLANPLATEVVPVLNGTEYTLSHARTGSTTLTGAAVGVAVDGSPVTFTASGTSLTVTLSGSPDYLWLEEKRFSGPPLGPGETRDAGDVTVVQGSTFGSNLYVGQPWNTISGVTETATHLVYDGTQADSSLAVRITGFPTTTGDVVELKYQVTDYVAGGIGMTVSLNPTPSRIVVSTSGIVTQTMTVGASQGDRLIFVGDDSFEGKILLSSISVAKVIAVAFPGQTGTSQTARYDWDPEGRTGEDFVVASWENAAGDEVRLYMVGGVLRLETFMASISQGFVSVPDKDDGLPHSAVIYLDSANDLMKLSVDGGSAVTSAPVPIPLDGSMTTGADTYEDILGMTHIVDGGKLKLTSVAGTQYAEVRLSFPVAGVLDTSSEYSFSCDVTSTDYAGSVAMTFDGQNPSNPYSEYAPSLVDGASSPFGTMTPVHAGDNDPSNSLRLRFRLMTAHSPGAVIFVDNLVYQRSNIAVPNDLNLIREGREAVGNHINGNVTLTAQANGNLLNAWAGI